MGFKAVLSRYSSATSTYQYFQLACSVENIVESSGESIHSSMRGMGYGSQVVAP